MNSVTCVMCSRFCLNIKTVFPGMCLNWKVKTAVMPLHLYNENNFYTGKTAS